MIITPIRTRIFMEGEPLGPFIRQHVPRLRERSILVVTSKVVALAEKRTASAEAPGGKAGLIKKESDAVIKTKHIHLTLKDGMLMAAAGIDASNADGKLILLPRDSFKAARALRAELMRAYKLKRLGVLITDSRTFPLRAGVIGLTTGFAGFEGVRDYRGMPDIFGRKLAFSRTNVADCLASAAVVEMGEAAEQQPLAVIEGATAAFTGAKMGRRSVSIPIEDDLYRPLLRPLIYKARASKLKR
ncbi:MAG: coenzyme F420-0:L-glutamate ligase [Patescibacteria group bacterium]|nr:coenzyme F420-0:L-glutamate ligase [Patescibacteria group bacterium]